MMFSNYNDINNLTNDRFKVLLALLRIGGIPVCMKKISKFYYIYSVTTTLSIYVVFIGSCLDVFVNNKESKELLTTIRLWSGITIVVILQVFMSFRRDKVEEAIYFTDSFVWEDLPERDPDTGSLTSAGLIARTNSAMKFIPIVILSTHLLQSSIRIVTQRATIYEVWYPFDVFKSPAYEICLISQVLASTGFGTLISAFSQFYIITVFIACSQLEKLRWKIKEINWTDATSKPHVEVRSEKEETDGQVDYNQKTLLHIDIKYKLDDCIKFHQLILQYMEKLEDTFHPMLGGYLLLSLGTLCFSAFSIVTNWEDFVDLIQALLGYIMFSVLLYIICNIGTKLDNEAQTIRDAAWDCDWIGSPIPLQRSNMYIIGRSSKQFTLTAAKFVPISMTTFMNMMQQTLSYFMFLLEMKNRNPETGDLD